MSGMPFQKRPRKRFLNIEIDDISFEELLENFKEGVLIPANADQLITLQENERFYEVYKKAEFVTMDSKIMQWLAAFMGQGVRSKISGSDFLPAYCNHHKDNDDIKIFLLGARPGVAHKAGEIINERTGREIIIGTHSPSMQVATDEEESRVIIDMINASGATVLGIGLGAPKQEIWIDQYRDQFINVKAFMAIGATIDFEAGEVDRAPEIMSSLGIEWLYRLCKEPGRMWHRYLVRDLPIFWYALKQKLGAYRDPFART